MDKKLRQVTDNIHGTIFLSKQKNAQELLPFLG